MEKNEEKLQEISGVSRLTFTDISQIKNIVTHYPPAYSRSIAYALRAAHMPDGKLGYMYKTTDCFVVIGIRNNNVYLTPLTDNHSYNQLLQLADTIARKLSCAVILRKLIDDTDTPAFQETKKIPPLFMEEDRYPEKIIKLRELFKPNEKQSLITSKTTKKIKTFEKTHVRLSILTSFEKITESMLSAFIKEKYEKRIAYVPLLQFLLKAKQLDMFRIFIFIKESTIHGIYVFEQLAPGIVGLYCGLTSTAYPGITEWLDYYVFSTLYEEGIKEIYLGGSESSGVETYIHQKLFQKTTPYSVSTKLVGEIPSFKDKVTIRLVTPKDFSALTQIYMQTYNTIPYLKEHWNLESARNLIVFLYYDYKELFFLAEIDKKIVGALQLRVAPWWNGKILEGGDFFVHPLYQSHGIGSLLLQHVLTVAREKYSVVELRTYAHRLHKDPTKWYKKLGLHDSYIMIMSGKVSEMLNKLQKK